MQKIQDGYDFAILTGLTMMVLTCWVTVAIVGWQIVPMAIAGTALGALIVYRYTREDGSDVGQDEVFSAEQQQRAKELRLLLHDDAVALTKHFRQVNRGCADKQLQTVRMANALKCESARERFQKRVKTARKLVSKKYWDELTDDPNDYLQPGEYAVEDPWKCYSLPELIGPDDVPGTGTTDHLTAEHSKSASIRERGDLLPFRR